MYACVGGVKEGVALILDSSLTDYYTPLWREKVEEREKKVEKLIYFVVSVNQITKRLL